MLGIGVNVGQAPRGPAPASSSATGSTCSSTSSSGSSTATTAGRSPRTLPAPLKRPAALSGASSLPSRCPRAAQRAAGRAPKVLAIHFAPDVNPVTQGWLNSQLDHAQSHGYSAAVILLDTPGGLEDSMRKIVQKELSLKIPGDRLRVAAAARGRRRPASGSPRRPTCSRWRRRRTSAPRRRSTANGANIGSDLRRKVINDAAASLRGLAKSHGRNAAWADKAVRVASNLTDTEALRMHVIDLISPILPALLKTIDGRVTTSAPPDAAHGGRDDRRGRARVPDALPLDPDRPEHRLAALPGRPRRARLRALPPRDRDSRARSARSAWSARSSASRSSRSRGPA